MIEQIEQGMELTDEKLVEMAERAKRDDWHYSFVGSDIRQLIGEVQRLRGSRIAELEGRLHGGEIGAAGDALDFALDRIDDLYEQGSFLDNWRHGDVDEWPEYRSWLATQRAGAAEPRAALAPHPEGTDQ